MNITPPEASVEECPGGPLLVRGAQRLVVDGHSRDVERPVVAVCRCGASALYPYCDSTHKLLAARESGPRRGEQSSTAG